MNVKKIRGWSALLSASLEGYKKNYFVLLPALIPFLFSVFIIQVSSTLRQLSPLSLEFLYVVGALVALTIISSVVGVFITAGILGVVKESAKKKSNKSDLKEFSHYAINKFLSLLGATIAVALVIFLIVFAATVSLVFNPWGVVGGSLLALAYLVLVAAAVFLLSFAKQAVVIANLGALDGVRESTEFVRKNTLPVIVFFLVLLGLWILVFIAASLLQVVLSFSPSLQSVALNFVLWIVSPYFAFLQGYYYIAKTKRRI